MIEEVHELNLNIAGKVKNTRLSTSKPLYPLYEAISNSIHSLEDQWGKKLTFHDKYNAYIEVISYDKLLTDAKKRNNILFDKLGLPT